MSRESNSQPTPTEWRARLEARPLPGEGAPAWQGVGPTSGYEAAAETLAHMMLVVADARPDLLDVTAERECDPSGWDAANNDKLMRALAERWPTWDDHCGGVTGFQWGWAHNIVRYVVGAPPTGNPAIMTVGE
jgi:hypothetical protein